MTEPVTEPADRGGIRAIAAPEAIGAVLAVVLLAGLVLGGGLTGLGGPGPDASAPAATPSASVLPSPSGLSTTTRSALLSALAVNQRLAAHVEPLQTAVDGDEATGATIAAILRAMNQDVAVGIRVAEPIALDPQTAVLGDDLRTLYREIARRDDETLQVSIQEAAVYRAAAAELVALLAGLPALDARIDATLEGRPAASGGVGPSASASPLPSPSATASPSPSASATPAPSASPSASPTAPSLVDNGTFDADLAGWSLQVAPDAHASATLDPTGGPDGSGAAHIEIRVGSGQRAGIALASSSFPLQRGRRYRVTASLRSSAVRDVRMRIATVAGQTTTARVFTVGTTWSIATFEITELAAGSSSVFALDVGRGDAPVWIDDVTIVAVGG